jgi:hypothetical protein
MIILTTQLRNNLYKLVNSTNSTRDYEQKVTQGKNHVMVSQKTPQNWRHSCESRKPVL